VYVGAYALAGAAALETLHLLPDPRRTAAEHAGQATILRHTPPLTAYTHTAGTLKTV
jgi:hypothetical protein